MAIRIPDEIFNIQKYTATVVSNDNVATFIKELAIKLDDGQTIQFKAGAYMQIDIPEYEADFKNFSVAERYKAAWKQFNLLTLKAKSDEPANRAYSLANPPIETDLLRFTIRIATPPPGCGGRPLPVWGSSYVFNLNPGDRVTISGPYGDFFAKETEREMCFFGRRRRNGTPAQPYPPAVIGGKHQATHYILVRRPVPAGDVLRRGVQRVGRAIS